MIGRTECWSSPLQFKLKSNVQCDGILRWGLWEVSRSWGWSPREEIIALIKEVRELVSYLSAMCREQVRMSPSNDINYLVKLWQNVCVLYSGTWWHFVFLCHGRKKDPQLCESLEVKWLPSRMYTGLRSYYCLWRNRKYFWSQTWRANWILQSYLRVNMYHPQFHLKKKVHLTTQKRLHHK